MLEAISFLVEVFLDLYVMVFILKMWFQFCNIEYYHPISQFLMKATYYPLQIMYIVIPRMRRIDFASFLCALCFLMLKWTLLLLLRNSDLPNFMPLFMLSFFNLIKDCGVLLFYTLILEIILSWVSNHYNPIYLLVSQLNALFLNGIRRVMPPVSGLDFSVMLLMIVLTFLNILFMQYIPYWSNL